MLSEEMHERKKFRSWYDHLFNLFVFITKLFHLFSASPLVLAPSYLWPV